MNAARGEQKRYAAWGDRLCAGAMIFQSNGFVPRMLSALLVCALLLPASGEAARLKPQTLKAFRHYVAVTEEHLKQQERDGRGFLWVDRLPEKERRAALEKCRSGEPVIQRIETRENGEVITVPDGMVHHWVATIFVPGVTLQETLAKLQDYDNYDKVYKPDIQEATLLSRHGEDFRVAMRLYRKTIVTAVYNAEFSIAYLPLEQNRAVSRAVTERIAEVENVGRPGEREKPENEGAGYLWRLNTYGRYEQRDGGVYIELETVALSRSVPAILAWLVNPYIRSIPREYLSRTLSLTRETLERERK